MKVKIDKISYKEFPIDVKPITANQTVELLNAILFELKRLNEYLRKKL